MPSLAALSQLPYSSFWRIDNLVIRSKNCGSTAFCAIIMLLSIFIVELNEVLKISTITAMSSQILTSILQ